MLSIFQFFATKTDASALRMLSGSPAERLLAPIADYITARGGRIHTRWGCREVLYDAAAPGGAPSAVTGLRLTKAGQEQVVRADAYVAALDVPGAKRLIPEAWRRDPFFDNIFRLVGVPVITVQLRYDGWVTEMADPARARSLAGGAAAGIDNLLYSADADFSCFADLALTSPVDYYKEGQGSLMQCVLTPADPYLAKSNEEIAAETDRQVRRLFPSAAGLTMTWHSIVKIGQSLYREAPGVDPFRPDQATPIPNFFLAGSYTKQDSIDSMEGATLSGRQCAYKVLAAAPALAAAAKAAQPAEAVAA
jgi:zeta-carotene desaturase